jgi:hypothetical protein
MTCHGPIDRERSEPWQDRGCVQWLVTSPRHERTAVAAIAALGATATIHRGPVSTAPDADIRFVFASDLASYLAEVSGRACERTILVNAERFAVLELLEAHDLGGAIECEEHDAWTSYDARMFVRKETVDLARGTVIGGVGRESERFVLWTKPDGNTRTCRLADLVRDCAGALRYFARRFDELVITAAAAASHGLPAIGLRMIVGHVGMMPEVFPEPGSYVRFVAPPGGPRAFGIAVCEDAAPEAVVRALDAKAMLVGTQEVQLAGASRITVLAETGRDYPMTHMGWCLVLIDHARGRLVVRVGEGIRGAGSWEALMRYDGFRILTESLVIT